MCSGEGSKISRDARAMNVRIGFRPDHSLGGEGVWGGGGWEKKISIRAPAGFFVGKLVFRGVKGVGEGGWDSRKLMVAGHARTTATC